MIAGSRDRAAKAGGKGNSWQAISRTESKGRIQDISG